MLETAQKWVDNHLATCTSDTCGCNEGDRQAMIDALLETWLFSGD